jgi:hypothetical protein
MSITSTVPRTLSQSSGSGQQIYTSDHPSDFNFPTDLDLTDQQSSQQDWQRYQVAEKNNERASDPLQRLTSAEPEQLPWSGIHLNGVPPSQRQQEQVQKSSSSSRTFRLGRQKSTVGSHANETDEGYYTYSQPDLRSMYSGDSNQTPRVRPGQSSIPRTIPPTQSTQGQPGLTTINANPYYRTMDFQVTEPAEQPTSSQVQQEPFACTETNCLFTFKTMSDLK